jgi:hypothetical protein
MRPPRTHIKALTYKEKIPGVLSGDIRQTIRPISYNLHTICGKSVITADPIRPGDKILFHGWADRPYRSPWSWRLKVNVQWVFFAKMYKEGMSCLQAQDKTLNIPTHRLGFIEWDLCDKLAQDDGIKDGKTMGELFNKMYTLESYRGNEINAKATKYFQIITWSWPPLDFEIRGCHYAEWDNEKPDFNKYLSEAPSC